MIVVVSVLILAASCAQKPIVPADFNKKTGYWEGKAYIKDHERGSIFQVSWMAFAQWPDKLRMDVNTDFGINLASLTLLENRMQLSLFREKKFISGPAEGSALKSLTKVEVDPYWINNFLFDRALLAKIWSCTEDAQGLPKSCERLGDQTKIEWSDRKGELKKFVIKHKKQEIIFWVTDFKPKVQTKSNPYVILKPKGFEEVSLN